MPYFIIFQNLFIIRWWCEVFVMHSPFNVVRMEQYVLHISYNNFLRTEISTNERATNSMGDGIGEGWKWDWDGRLREEGWVSRFQAYVVRTHWHHIPSQITYWTMSEREINGKSALSFSKVKLTSKGRENGLERGNNSFFFRCGNIQIASNYSNCCVE